MSDTMPFSAIQPTTDSHGRPARPPRVRPARPCRGPWLLLVALALCAAALTLMIGRTASAPSSGLPYRSDPATTWRRGHVPALYQTDPQWASASYAGATLGTAGCGPTCLAAVAVACTGNTDLTPPALASYAKGNGHVTQGLTAWTLMTDGARGLGLDVREEPADAAAVRAALASGRPVIASVGPGDFTSDGHFIVLTSVDADGSLHVMDPNSRPRSQRVWDLQAVLRQCRGLWSYSAA